jgi:hypothetical protein
MRKGKNRSDGRDRAIRRGVLLLLAVLAFAGVSGCSTYAGVDIGAPMKVGPVYINPSIGIGGYL